MIPHKQCWWDAYEELPVGTRIVLVRDVRAARAGSYGRISGPPEGAHMSVNGVLAEVLIDGAAAPTTMHEADFRPVD